MLVGAVDRLVATFLQDVRHTFRQWRQAPAFASVAVLTIALGIGGVTTVLSVTNAAFLRSRHGVRKPAELVEIRIADRSGRRRRPMTHADYQVLRASDLGLRGLAGAYASQVSVATGDAEGADLVAGMAVSGDYFPLLETRAAIGRLITADDDRSARSEPVAVLSHRYWTRRFARDASVLGRAVTINRVPFTIIGVAEAGFEGHLPIYDYDVFVPLATVGTLAGAIPEVRSRFSTLTIGRLAPGSSIARVAAASRRVAEELRKTSPGGWFSTVFVVEPHTRNFQQFRGPVSLFLLFLVALSGCILFIACANIAGILLARAVSRSHEMAVRLALGAGRVRLVARLLTESVLLFCVGGASGMALAFWATRLLGRLSLPLSVPLTSDFAPDLQVFGVSLLLTVLAGGAFGLAPALHAMRTDVASFLKEERLFTAGRQWLRKTFVVAQISGAVAVLACCGVLLRALHRATTVDLGIEPEGLHVVTVDLGIQQYSEDEGRTFFSSLLGRATVMPGVESAALADFLPLASPPERSGVFSNSDGNASVEAGIIGVSPGFFQTVQTHIIAGRPFEEEDVAGSEPVAIVNEVVARLLWPGREALGRTLKSGDSALRVVGVARQGKYISIGETPLAAVFRPRAQTYVPATSLVVRAKQRPDMGESLERLVHELDSRLPLSTNAPYEDLIAVSLLPRSAAAVFAGVLGALGLFLALVGLYGVLSSQVALRARELAVRTALGAQPGALLASVLREGLGLVLAGLLLGVPVALGVTSLIRAFLFGLAPADPLTYGGIAILCLVVGVTASYAPAARATRADPVRALRQL
jgi:predicted permease